MPPDIKTIINRKRNGDSTIPPEWRVLLTEVFKTYLEERGAGFMKAFEEKVNEAATGLEGKIIKELKAVVLAHMPIPADGHTPTDEELLELIRPLIPEVEDGEDADPEEVIQEVLERLPKPVDGKTPTKKDILALLKPLIADFEARFDRKFNTALRTIQANAKGQKQAPQGGGMGNWVHQSFTISSATTTKSLTYNVAAGGMAHLCRYQGQMLAYGVQYTISGKIITLLFTPEDSTVLDVTYVRT